MHPQILRTLCSARTRLRAELDAIELRGHVPMSEREELLLERLAAIEARLKQQQQDPVRH